MNFSQLLKEKVKYSKLLKEEYNFPKKNKFNWLIVLNNKDILIDFIDSLWNLQANFVIITDLKLKNLNNVSLQNELNRKFTIWFDFILCDNNIYSLTDYLKQGIVPIISKENYMSSILNEFNPIKNTWNSFLYESNNKWSIFYSLVRYLENSKFTFDNKNLVKNVLDI
jgi:hypothetical protein